MTDQTNSREIALDVLTEVLEEGGFGHLVLNRALEKYLYLEKRERAFVTRLVEGTIEYVIQIDAVIDQASKIKVKKMKPFIRTLLRMSVYQILYMERVPDSAVCNEAVKLAKKRRFSGLSGFVNGVLRSVSRKKEELAFDDPALRYAMPQWIFSLFERQYGRERAERIAAAFLEERPLTVRVNTSLTTAEEAKESLKKQGIAAEAWGGLRPDRRFSLLTLSGYDSLEMVEEFLDGRITVQDPSSALAACAADPENGQFVLDVCSAPGGKSIHAADLLAGSGMVEARDLTEYKIGLVRENVERCGFSNIREKVWDAVVFDETMEEKADIVLADLPCSGLGILGKKPDIKLRLKEEDLLKLQSLQRTILETVFRYVKPGGLMIYSTCTINEGENEENADWILENLPFEPESLKDRIPDAFLSHCTGPDAHRIQILPDAFACDGFFVAAFRRKTDGEEA